MEEGEECDCGWEDECADRCCYPQTSGIPEHTPCKLRPGAKCRSLEYICKHSKLILVLF